MYSAHALSTVDSSSTNFLNTLNQCILLRENGKTVLKKKIWRSTYRSLQEVHLKVGSPCWSDFALTLMNTFSDYYFTAALWT